MNEWRGWTKEANERLPMTVDSTPLGLVAAKVIDDISDDPDLGEDATVISALVIVEIQHTDPDGDVCSTVSARATDGRNVIGLGLAERARQALLQGGYD